MRIKLGLVKSGVCVPVPGPMSRTTPSTVARRGGISADEPTRGASMVSRAPGCRDVRVSFFSSFFLLVLEMCIIIFFCF